MSTTELVFCDVCGEDLRDNCVDNDSVKDSVKNVSICAFVVDIPSYPMHTKKEIGFSKVWQKTFSYLLLLRT